MASKTYNNETLARQEAKRRPSETASPWTYKNQRGQAVPAPAAEPSIDELLAQAKSALDDSGALSWDLNNTPFPNLPPQTPHARLTAQPSQSWLSRANQSLQGLNGERGIENHPLVQAANSPAGQLMVGELAGPAIGRGIGAGIRGLKSAAGFGPVVESAPKVSRGMFEGFENISQLPRKAEGGENLAKYAAGETPASIVRGGKPGRFIKPEQYQEQHALEGLQTAGQNYRQGKQASEARQVATAAARPFEELNAHNAMGGAIQRGRTAEGMLTPEDDLNQVLQGLRNRMLSMRGNR